MYLLITNQEDTQNFWAFESLDSAKTKFKEEVEDQYNIGVFLCQPKDGDQFGFGYHGFYGCEVIEEWERDFC